MNITKETTLGQFKEMVDEAQKGDQDLGDYLCNLKKNKWGRSSYRMPLCFLMGLLLRSFPNRNQPYSLLTDDSAVGPGAQDFLAGVNNRPDVPTPKLRGDYWKLTEESTIQDVYNLINDGKMKNDDINIDQYLEMNGQEKKKVVLGILDDICGEKTSENANLRTKSKPEDNNLEILIKNKLTGNQKQIVFTGAPGTGKTYCVRKYAEDNAEGRFEFVQFHSSYDYTDFVEGLRPVFVGNMDKPECSFVKMDGIFKKFCRKIIAENKEALAKNPTEDLPAYYFIIDEINRADLSKVFGELMFCLEESYRGDKHRTKTQYQNLPTYEYVEETEEDGTIMKRAQLLKNDCFQDGFYIPENLYIIGTMNDIDRSVEAFDFALRRRFQWINIESNKYIGNSLISMKVIKDDKDPLIKKIRKMNGTMEKSNFGLNEAYHLGAAYFKDYDVNNSDSSLEKIFDEKIEPILREYTRGRDRESVQRFIVKCRNSLLYEGEQDN